MPVAFSADGTRLLAFSGDPTTYPFTEQLWAVDVPSGRMKALTGWAQIVPVGLSSGGATVLAIAAAGECSRRSRSQGESRTSSFAARAAASWNAR